MPLLRRQHQSGTKERAHAWRPAQREDHTKEHGGKESHITTVYSFTASPEQIHFENTKKIESKKNDHQAGNHIHRASVFPQETTNRARQRTHCHKDDGKSADKSQCAG